MVMVIIVFYLIWWLLSLVLCVEDQIVIGMIWIVLFCVESVIFLLVRCSVLWLKILVCQFDSVGRFCVFEVMVFRFEVEVIRCGVMLVLFDFVFRSMCSRLVSVVLLGWLGLFGVGFGRFFVLIFCLMVVRMLLVILLWWVLCSSRWDLFRLVLESGLVEVSLISVLFLKICVWGMLCFCV